VTGISVDFPKSADPERAIGYVVAAVAGLPELEEAEGIGDADAADEADLDGTDGA
jgi:hypothetical protein